MQLVLDSSDMARLSVAARGEILRLLSGEAPTGTTAAASAARRNFRWRQPHDVGLPLLRKLLKGADGATRDDRAGIVFCGGIVRTRVGGRPNRIRCGANCWHPRWRWFASGRGGGLGWAHGAWYTRRMPRLTTDKSPIKPIMIGPSGWRKVVRACRCCCSR